MKITLPITFELPIQEDSLENLRIDFGATEAKHKRVAEDSKHVFSSEVASAGVNKIKALNDLWGQLMQQVSLPYDVPERVPHLLALSLLCEWYKVSVNVKQVELENTEDGRAIWSTEVEVTDADGIRRNNDFAMSDPFDPSDKDVSMKQFFGAIVDAYREAISSYFALAISDDQDVK